jgi:hypothetical protein
MTITNIDIHNWHDVVLFYMPLAQSVGFRVAYRRGWHIDEAIAEAYYLLTSRVLWLLLNKPEITEETPALLVMHMRRNIVKYFQRHRPVAFEDVFGVANSIESLKNKLLAIPPINVSIETLMNELVENDRQLSVLILLVERYNKKEIAQLLNLDYEIVKKIANDIEDRLLLQRKDA